MVEDRISRIARNTIFHMDINNDNNSNNGYQNPIADLWKPETVIFEGHNRHLALLRIMESELQRNRGINTFRRY